MKSSVNEYANYEVQNSKALIEHTSKSSSFRDSPSAKGRPHTGPCTIQEHPTQFHTTSSTAHTCFPPVPSTNTPMNRPDSLVKLSTSHSCYPGTFKRGGGCSIAPKGGICGMYNRHYLWRIGVFRHLHRSFLECKREGEDGSKDLFDWLICFLSKECR